MKSSIRNEIKAQIIRAGYTMQEVVDQLHDEYGWSDSVSNLSGKLQRESLRYREAVKRDNNNVFDFLESEGYIRLKADASISSKDCYDIYRMWCEENSLTALKRRSFSDALVAACGKYNLEHCNTITNSAGRRVWGFMGIEAVARPHINEFTDASQCTYVPEDWRD